MAGGGATAGFVAEGVGTGSSPGPAVGGRAPADGAAVPGMLTGTLGMYGDVPGCSTFVPVGILGRYGDVPGCSTLVPAGTLGMYGDVPGFSTLVPAGTLGMYGDMPGFSTLVPAGTLGTYGDVAGRSTLLPAGACGSQLGLPPIPGSGARFSRSSSVPRMRADPAPLSTSKSAGGGADSGGVVGTSLPSASIPG